MKFESFEFLYQQLSFHLSVSINIVCCSISQRWFFFEQMQGLISSKRHCPDQCTSSFLRPVVPLPAMYYGAFGSNSSYCFFMLLLTLFPAYNKNLFYKQTKCIEYRKSTHHCLKQMRHYSCLSIFRNITV